MDHSESEYIKLSNLSNLSLNETTTNDSSNCLPTVQLQPQPRVSTDMTQQIKLVVIGKRGCIKNYINSFEIFSSIQVKMYELLNDENVIIDSLRTNNKIPILELVLSNDIRLYFAFTANKALDFASVHNACISGKLTLELYSNGGPLLKPVDYQYVDQKKLLEDLIEYLFTECQAVINCCKC